jgi:two-component SAPR family response regulator
MRYRVRNAAGEELTVPSLGDLVRLYEGGFLGDEDLVRAETANRWVRAGAMDALHGVRERRRDPRRLGLLLIAAVALVTGLGILLAR